jgi:hypothetical protein
MSPSGSRRSIVQAQIPQSSPIAIWLLLTGVLLIPANITFFLSEAKFTTGRSVIILLVIPAVLKFVGESRRIIAADVFAFCMAVWMLGAGMNSSAVAEVIEFFGGYLVARSFVFGPIALQQFVRTLKSIAVIVILLAMLDPLFGMGVARTITEVGFQSALGTASKQLRFGLVRATSTFPVAEIYGLFCCAIGALLVFFERKTSSRIRWVGFCLFGCFLSLSSGPILTFALILMFYAYDRLLKSWLFRWKALTIVTAAFIGSVFLLAPSPVSWFVSHMTLDPQTGYFRMYVFDYAFHNISLSPIVGYGFRDDIGNDDFLAKASIDNVWIVLSLRFGIPVAAFLLLANICSFWPSGLRPGMIGTPTHQAGTAFTFVLMAFMLVGLTVHYWDEIWIFWGICLGVRSSIKEWTIVLSKESAVAPTNVRPPFAPPQAA